MYSRFTRYLPDCGLWGVVRSLFVAFLDPAGLAGGPPKILLAEDDNDMRRFVKALENAGYEVSYDNGLSAYQRLREEPFDCCSPIS